MLEDSVGTDVCDNCLCCECDWETCTTPVESLLFHEASRSVIDDEMWDMVSKAKSNNPPLSKEAFLQTNKRMIAGRMMTTRMEIMATRKKRMALLKRAADSAAT
jgi:hypothetical protein